jgi:hypothetical protein
MSKIPIELELKEEEYSSLLVSSNTDPSNITVNFICCSKFMKKKKGPQKKRTTLKVFNSKTFIFGMMEKYAKSRIF